MANMFFNLSQDEAQRSLELFCLPWTEKQRFKFKF